MKVDNYAPFLAAGPCLVIAREYAEQCDVVVAKRVAFLKEIGASNGYVSGHRQDVIGFVFAHAGSVVPDGLRKHANGEMWVPNGRTKAGKVWTELMRGLAFPSDAELTKRLSNGAMSAVIDMTQQTMRWSDVLRLRPDTYIIMVPYLRDAPAFIPEGGERLKISAYYALLEADEEAAIAEAAEAQGAA